MTREAGLLFVVFVIVVTTQTYSITATESQPDYEPLPQGIVTTLRRSMTPDQVRSTLGRTLQLVGPVDLGVSGSLAYGVYHCPESRDCNKGSSVTDPRIKDTGLLLTFTAGKLTFLQQTRYKTNSRTNDHASVLNALLRAAGSCVSSVNSSQKDAFVFNTTRYACRNSDISVVTREFSYNGVIRDFQLSVVEGWPAP
jgi:hypothetical protein